jgi:hypothetical protein
MRQVDTYREWAEECRQSAYKAMRPQDEAFFLRWANDWMKLAEECERADPVSQIPDKSANRARPVLPR